MALCLKEGNKNTKFCLKHQITIRDTWQTRGARGDYYGTNKNKRRDGKLYNKLYTEGVEWRPIGNISNCPRIIEYAKEVLQGETEEPDVYNYLKIWEVDKAPGPNGHTILHEVLGGSKVEYHVSFPQLPLLRDVWKKFQCYLYSPNTQKNGQMSWKISDRLVL